MLPPLLALCFAANAQVDATKLFQAVEPSVVLISSEEGSGSGVVLTADGLILTNYHVVNTPLPMTVEAIVEQGGKRERKTFPGTPLKKVHLRNDLALLKVEAEGVSFFAARLSKSPGDAAAGATCYVLGFPAVSAVDKPQISITKGIISSAKRMIGGEPFIQLDAALNPGNSGGALVNESGVLVGIPTLRFEGVENIGMASPIFELRMDQFVDKEDRIGNPEEARRLSDIAATYYLRDALTLGSDPYSVLVAVYLQRQALALEPGNPEWSMAISSMYFRLGEPKLARAYAEAAVNLGPRDIASRMWLASVVESLGEAEEALRRRLECLAYLADESDLTKKKTMFEELLDQMLDRNDRLRALYLLSWANAEVGEIQGVRQRLVRQGAENAFPADFVRRIVEMKRGHSVDDMEALANSAPDPGSIPPSVPSPAAPLHPTPSTSESKPSSIVSKVTFAAGTDASLSDASPGVVFHPDRGTLEWTPPLYSRIPEARALFVIKNPDGSEELRVHVIQRK